MTVRSVRLPTNLWIALVAGLEQANAGRKRPILLSDLIRGLLEHGLTDPKLLAQVGTKRARPKHVIDELERTAPHETIPTAQVTASVEQPVGSALTSGITVSQRLHRARVTGNLSAGKIVDQICRLHSIETDILKAVRKQLYDHAIGNPIAEPLSLIAIAAATNWLNTIEATSEGEV